MSSFKNAVGASRHAGGCRPTFGRSAARARQVLVAAAPPIMVNSCTGKMGHATAEAVVRAGLELVPFTFCGASAGVAVGNIGVNGVPVERVSPEKRAQVMEDVKAKYPGLVIIDYTLPAAVNDNAAFYCAHGVPFVMGTTGGDRPKLIEDTKAAGTYAVIAPQMGKQVVAFQAMMESMAENFPGAFSGYTLEVIESHQSTKVDTSGTAKAIVESFRDLGLNFTIEEIQKVRDPMVQMEEMHVPKEYIDGHAFHTYRLKSPDNTVAFEFQHNVCGRTIYAEGTVDAALFLKSVIDDSADKKVYNMVDVLRAGSMR